jgi:hypothetical protein
MAARADPRIGRKPLQQATSTENAPPGRRGASGVTTGRRDGPSAAMKIAVSERIIPPSRRDFLLCRSQFAVLLKKLGLLTISPSIPYTPPHQQPSEGFMTPDAP